MFDVDTAQGIGARVVPAPRRRQYVLRRGHLARAFLSIIARAFLSYSSPCLKRGHRRVAGLTHFVAAALPKPPICALKLGDRTTLTDVARELLAGFRHA